MTNPLVSIITPNFNSEKYISETIESVLQQTYKNWELIIVDDFSTDTSVTLIKEFQEKDQRIKLVKLSKNSGPAVARNEGIKIAKGNFLTFIDSDDVWLPKFIETSLLYEKKSQGFVFASYHRFDENLKPKHRDFIVPNKVAYFDILKTNSISCLTAFINVDMLGKKLMPQVNYRQDMGLWLSYLKIIDYAIGIKIPLAIYRIREGSHSRNKLNLVLHQWQFYRNIEGLTVLTTAYYFLLWMFYGVKKYYF